MKTTSKLKLASVLLFAAALAIVSVSGCSGWAQSCVTADEACIFPDYTDIAIPVNIAPLNFRKEGASALKLDISGAHGHYSFSSCSENMRFNLKKWKKILEKECGSRLEVTLEARMNGEWKAFRPFYWEVRREKIDSYISYRLIEPAYEVWNMLSIEERCTENFKARKIADNAVTFRSCMNCHTSNRAGSPTTFLHARSRNGATVYQHEGRIRKIDTSSDSTSGVAVYGEISKDGRWGIFTTADILNGLHSAPMERFEVFDASSDLILIDFQNNTITDSPSVKGPQFQETFPCWGADNRTIYFCRAAALEQPARTKEMHYDLYSISFDPTTGRLGNDLKKVFDAASIGKSVSFPKCSPDGKKILVSVSDYGTFPIWHVETDLWMIDIATGTADRMENTNGRYSDSYHCWSTNGRWICWASKRDDRVYGRPYFAFVAEDGTTGKPFVLPQKNPDRYITSFKSFNIPELYNDPESYGAWDMRRFYNTTETEHLTYTK